MIGLHRNPYVFTDLLIDMAWEDRLQLAACRQLQAIQGRCTEEALADDACAQLAVWRMHDVIGPQQHIHRASRRHDVRTVAP
ncbi:hypothetical protein D3C79_943200 [compost metagenome]